MQRGTHSSPSAQLQAVADTCPTSIACCPCTAGRVTQSLCTAASVPAHSPDAAGAASPHPHGLLQPAMLPPLPLIAVRIPQQPECPLASRCQHHGAAAGAGCRWSLHLPGAVMHCHHKSPERLPHLQQAVCMSGLGLLSGLAHAAVQLNLQLSAQSQGEQPRNKGPQHQQLQPTHRRLQQASERHHLPRRILQPARCQMLA